MLRCKFLYDSDPCSSLTLQTYLPKNLSHKLLKEVKAQQQEENEEFPALSRANLEKSKPVKSAFQVDFDYEDEEDPLPEGLTMDDIVRAEKSAGRQRFSV